MMSRKVEPGYVTNELKKGKPTSLKLSIAGRVTSGSCHKRQKPQAPTPQALIPNRRTREVANAKGLNRITNLT